MTAFIGIGIVEMVILAVLALGIGFVIIYMFMGKSDDESKMMVTPVLNSTMR